MREYATKRLLVMVPTLLLASILIFVVMRILPGSVAYTILGNDATLENVAIVEKQLGLDQPLATQYLSWMRQLLTFDLGTSLLHRGVSVSTLILKAAPVSITLAIYSMLIAMIVAIPFGVASALRHDTWVDYSLRTISITGVALPVFWTAIIILLILLRGFGWNPSLEYTGFFDNPWENFKKLIWPALAVSSYLVAIIVRMLRSTLLEVLGEDYVRTARAKGLWGRIVIMRHALPNALLPVITLAGAQFANMLGGFVVTETVFSLPGLGKLIVSTAQARDYPVMQDLFLYIVLITMIANLLVDLSYGLLDPRIRQG